MEVRTRNTKEALLGRMAAFHAACELQAAHNGGNALKYLRPGTDSPWDLSSEFRDMRRLIAEEFKHYEMVQKVLCDLVTPSLADAILEELLAPMAPKLLPEPVSFIDQIVHLTIGDRAGRLQIESLLACAHAPYAKVAAAMIKDEHRHQDEALEKLRTWVGKKPELRSEISTAVERQTRIALALFGRPGSSADKAAVELGLKSRSASELVTMLLKEVAQCKHVLGIGDT